MDFDKAHVACCRCKQVAGQFSGIASREATANSIVVLLFAVVI
jgi:hypothetical protein